MSLVELFLIAVGLSMDAFAVSVCKGLSTPRVRAGNMLVTGLWFGFFQALMPAAGYLLGVRFSSLIQSVDHWIAFVLLSFIGANMIGEPEVNTKRFRVYRRFMATYFTEDVFEHLFNIKKSTYLLVRKTELEGRPGLLLELDKKFSELYSFFD